MKRTIVRFAGLAALLAAGTVRSAELHVAPAASAKGSGSRTRPLDIVTALSAGSPAEPGDIIILAGGTYAASAPGVFDIGVSGQRERRIQIRPEKGARVHLNGTVNFTASWTDLIGVDIGDLDWTPEGGSKLKDALTTAKGTNSRVINCNIFGGRQGISAWEGARNLEIYGCLIHDFGYIEGPGRGHGHAFYSQNKEGTKTFRHNIAFRGLGWNVHIYGKSGSLIGYDLIENICFLPGGLKPGQDTDNYLVTGEQPADRIRVIGNVGYKAGGGRPNLRLAPQVPMSGTASIRDNCLIGGTPAAALGRWTTLDFTGNTVWAPATYVTSQQDKGGAWDIAGNTYLDNGHSTPFRRGEADMSFTDWRKSGNDRDGTRRHGPAAPHGVRVFVFPNQYEPGRANVAALCWDKRDAVEADLSKALNKGQSFAVYNCLDIRQTLASAKPVLVATYQGAAVSLPLRHDPQTPHFDAFLVMPAEQKKGRGPSGRN
jgi:hypothetical protein